MFAAIFEDVHRNFAIVTFLHSLLGTACEYNYYAVNIPYKLLKTFINESVYAHYSTALSSSELEWIWSAILAAPALGAVIGGLLMRPMTQSFGRRNTIMVWNNIFLIVASLLQLVCEALLSFELLLIGRIVAGLSIGTYCILPVYLAECAPHACRGFVGTVWGVGGCLWGLLACVLGLPYLLGQKNLWPFLLAFPAVPAVMHLALTSVFPKSPKYLYITLREEKLAEESLKFYQGPQANIQERFEEYKREAEQAQQERKCTLKEVLQSPHLRFALIVCLVVNVAVDLGGIDIVANFSTYIFSEAGLNDLEAAYGTIAISLLCLVLAAIAPFFVERFGRRPMLLLCVGLGVLATTCLFIAAFDSLSSTVRITFSVLGVLTVYSSMTFGLWRLCSLLPGEICPQGCRPIVASLSCVANWTPSIIILMLFSSVELAIGAYSYLPFVIIGIGFFFWLYRYLPETKNRSVDSIVGQLMCGNGGPEPNSGAEDWRQNEKTKLVGESSNSATRYI